MPRVLESLPTDRAQGGRRGRPVRRPAARQARWRCGCRCPSARKRRARRCAARCRPRSRCGTGSSRKARPARPGAPGAGGVRRRAPAVHRRDHGHAEGRDAHAPQPRRERRPGPGVDRRRAGHGGRLRRPPVLPRLRADALPQLRDPRRRDARRVPVLRPRARARRAAAPARHVPAGRPADARPPRGRRRAPARTSASFRYAISGAMALPAATAQAWEEVTGGLVIEGYGMTETSPVALGNPLDRRPTARHPRPAVPEHEHPGRRPDGRHARRRAGGARRAADPRPAGVRRVLAAARRDRRAAARRRLAAHRATS